MGKERKEERGKERRGEQGKERKEKFKMPNNYIL